VTPERWRQIEELYHAARELPVPGRSGLLERADPELRAVVTSLLARENGATFLEQPAWEDHASLLNHADPPIGDGWQTETVIAAGRLMGPYRIEQKIGQGGMGEVFRAVDTRLDRVVAIKVSFVRFSDRFQREARLIASLNHPHIAALFDIGTLPSGAGYLVLEYVEGLTLAELIKKGPLEPKLAQRIALETAEAIEAAHERGIVHRDLKPSNIKLGANGVVKVLDFGLAKAMDEAEPLPDGAMTRPGTIFGTPCYMSPEQALGGPADRRSDIWSFGVLVSEMLTGKRLFTGGSGSSILASVVRGEPVLLGIPPEWEPLLRRCLIRDVRRRLQSIGEARLMLEDGLPATAAPVPTRAEARRAFLLRSPVLWILLAAAAASVGAMLQQVRSQPQNPLANATFMRLTNYEGTEQDAAISPDGKFVAFLSARAPSRVAS